MASSLPRHRDQPIQTDPGGPRAARRGDRGVEANARITGATAAILVVLLAIEGATIVSVRSLLTPHVLIGMVLVPPVALKIATTSWRFARYYRGAPAYRRKGPPNVILRFLGPFLVILTLAMFASGILVLLGPHALRSQTLFVHKASFVLWFGAMTIHVLGHARETMHLAPLDWARRTRRELSGAGARQTALTLSLIAGAVLGALTVGQVGHYLDSLRFRPR